MSNNWNVVPFTEAVDICDTFRKPINSSERASRIKGKEQSELYPYYGATGQVGFIDDYITDGEYVLLGEDGAPFLDAFSNKAYIISGKTWVNNHAHVLRSKTNNKFLCYYLNGFNYKGYVSGTTRLKLTQAEMKRIPVPVPPLPEQERIVARIEELFSQLDAGVETLKKTKAQLAVYRQAVLKEAFESVIPESDTCNVEDVCKDIKVGIVIKPAQYYTSADVGVRAFRSANVREFAVNDSDWVYLTKAGHEANLRSEIHTGDVLVVRSGYPGTACVVPPTYNGCNAIDILIAVPYAEKILPEYLCAYTNSPLGKRIIQEKKRGVAQAHFNVSGYSKTPIIVPCLETQKRVVAEIDSRLSLCDSIEQTVDAALQQAEAMRQSILKDAFKGEL